MSESLKQIKNIQVKMTLKVESINNSVYTKRYKADEQIQKKEKTLKIATSIGTIAGISGVMLMTAKKNPLELAKNIKNPKQILNNLKKIELNGKDVMKIATGSVLGGFIGGSIVDRDNSKAKMKEGVTQLIGNYIVPSAFVSSGIKLNGILNKKFNFPPNNKIYNFAFGITSLVLGVLSGNKISKEVNKRIFKEDNNHDLSYKDWSMQMDNLCLVTSMANKGTNIAKTASKLIPVMHFVPGYLTGIKK